MLKNDKRLEINLAFLLWVTLSTVRIDEQHDGDEYDPIPYDGNMALEKDKYYIQNNVVYLCTRNSDIALHNPLDELVGLYVEVVESTL